MREDLYKAISNYKATAKKSEEWDQLAPENQRYVNHLLRDFERNGL